MFKTLTNKKGAATLFCMFLLWVAIASTSVAVKKTRECCPCDEKKKISQVEKKIAPVCEISSPDNGHIYASNDTIRTE